LANPVPVLQNVAATIPQVQLPAGMGCTFDESCSCGSTCTTTANKKGERKRKGIGPLHNISGGQADPVLNGLHRGHIALRERTADYNAHVEQLQERENAVDSGNWHYY